MVIHVMTVLMLCCVVHGVTRNVREVVSCVSDVAIVVGDCVVCCVCCITFIFVNRVRFIVTSLVIAHHILVILFCNTT